MSMHQQSESLSGVSDKQPSGTTEHMSSSMDGGFGAGSPSSPQGPEQSAGPATPPDSGSEAKHVVVCQVIGCNEVLTKSYCMKKKTCTAHMQAEAVRLHHATDPTPWRFCQQCGKFETLNKFDDNKRSCRARLAKRRSGTRAQLIKKGCIPRSAETTPTQSDGGALAASQAAKARATDAASADPATLAAMMAPAAAIASNELPKIGSDWGSHLLVQSTYSVQLPVLGDYVGSMAAIRHHQEVQASRRTTPQSSAGASGGAAASEAAAPAAQRCASQGASLSGGAPGAAAAAATAAAAVAEAADRHALSAPLLSLSSFFPGLSGPRADVPQDPFASGPLLQWVDGDDSQDDPMTEAELLAALQEEMEGDSTMWQPLLNMQPQQSLSGSGGLIPAAAAGRAAAGGGFGAGSFTATAGHQMLNLPPGASPANSAGAGGSASDGAAMPGSSGSASLPRLGSNVSSAAGQGGGLPVQRTVSASAAAGQLGSASSAGAALLGQLSLPPLISERSSSQNSSRLQWLVQQVQLELQNCSTNDLECLGETELATLLHAALAPGSVAGPLAREKSDTSAAAAGASASPKAAVQHVDPQLGLQQQLNQVQLLQQELAATQQQQQLQPGEELHSMGSMHAGQHADDFMFGLSKPPVARTASCNTSMTAPLPSFQFGMHHGAVLPRRRSPMLTQQQQQHQQLMMMQQQHHQQQQQHQMMLLQEQQQQQAMIQQQLLQVQQQQEEGRVIRQMSAPAATMVAAMQQQQQQQQLSDDDGSMHGQAGQQLMLLESYVKQAQSMMASLLVQQQAGA